MFTVFNILQRQVILLHTSLKVKAQNFDSVAATLNAISADTIQSVCDCIAHGDAKSFQNDDDARFAAFERGQCCCIQCCRFLSVLCGNAQ